MRIQFSIFLILPFTFFQLLVNMFVFTPIKKNKGILKSGKGNKELKQRTKEKIAHLEEEVFPSFKFFNRDKCTTT